MAVAEQQGDRRLVEIVEEVMRALGRRGIREGNASEAPGVLRVELEENIKRVIQVYWTPFEADVPGRSIGLHLEVAEPRVHWAECYLTPDYRNWFFCFHERPDGDIQLAYHQDYATPQEALRGFFNLASWYVLTPTDRTWDDIVLQMSPELDWGDSLEVLSGSSSAAPVQEALKKSTIIWMRWETGSEQHTMPVWYVNDKGRIYVLSGERQQTIPGAAELRECDVILRWKGKNARIAEIPASVKVIEPGPEWDQAAEKIAEKRLNIPGLPEETARRWREECVILELILRG
ncbi:MAG: hypothetical protein M3360_04340 [Actinomycetota bacterium]|nr:hypothetical protein [Actinomycetota bacterium]